MRTRATPNDRRMGDRHNEETFARAETIGNASASEFWGRRFLRESRISFRERQTNPHENKLKDNDCRNDGWGQHSRRIIRPWLDDEKMGVCLSDAVLQWR